MTIQHRNQREETQQLSLSNVNFPVQQLQIDQNNPKHYFNLQLLSTLQTQLYSVIKPEVYQKDHQNFSNFLKEYFHMFVAKWYWRQQYIIIIVILY